MNLDGMCDAAVLRLKAAGRTMDAERLDGANAMIQHPDWPATTASTSNKRLNLIRDSADVALRILARERDGGPDGGLAQTKEH